MAAESYGSSTQLTGARQTMSTWARVIDSIQDVPAIYRYPYQKLIGGRDSMPYTVLAPAQGGPRNRKPAERLLFEIDGTFYVLERADSQVVIAGFGYADISSLEVGNILLYSWFSIHGRTISGADATMTIEFNEATLRHFEPFFRKMRPAPDHTSAVDLAAEHAKFDGLSVANFKLANFARESLRPGARVLQAIYQPANRQRLATVFGHSIYRTVFLDHLTVLTGQEMILLGDAEGIAENKRSKYGGVQRYLPLRSLTAVAVEERSESLTSCTFQVSPEIRVERLFDASRRAEIEKLAQTLQALR